MGIVKVIETAVYLMIVQIAAEELVAVTTNDHEQDEENQDQREVVETVKDPHLLTPPTLRVNTYAM